MELKQKNDFFGCLVGKFSANVIREIILAFEGFKVSRIAVDELDLASFIDLLERNGLYTAIHDQKYICSPDAGKGGWTNQYGVEVPLEVGHGALLVYIANTPQKAFAAMQQEQCQDDRGFGNLLSIPSCCIDFYINHIEDASALQSDFLPFVAKSTAKGTPYSYWNNIAAQYFFGSLISFYPCSFACKASEYVSKESYRILCYYSETWASKLLATHRSNIIYTEYEGIYLFDESSFDGDRIVYDGNHISATLQGVIYNALKRGNTLKINNLSSAEILNDSEHISSMCSESLNILLFNY